ncbi:MAG: PocR ligand-binding domain-containing protein [Deltaproteobacteria bacterium]|nr:PocR ligand-binding domain-containing protein [Deltaproteobacteria bacterium]
MLVLDRSLGLADLVEPGGLRELCTSFHALFGLGMRVHASDGTLLAEAAPESEYCAYLREFPEGRRQCKQLRARLAGLADTPEAPTSVRCFGGCAYLAVRVLFEGDEMGRVVYGPFLPADSAGLVPSAAGLGAPLDAVRLRELSGSLRRVDRATLDRIVAAFQRILDLILQGGRRALLTSDAHHAVVEESYREVAEKNRQLRETTERLQELDRLKSNFLATVSHELRTPLTSIIGYSEMLSQGLAGPLNDEQRRFLGTILEKGEALLRLISAILDVSTLDASRIALQRRSLDLRHLCRRAADQALVQSSRKDVRVQFREGYIVPPVEADPELIEKALVNLLDNALKYSPPSGVVEVEVGLTEPEVDEDSEVGFVLLAPTRRYVEVGIHDAGPGIPEPELDRVFDAFYQVDGSATRAHGGLGIGLALAQQFVRAHGGEIRVESRPGHGSVFRLLLPLPPGAET